jgi:hypothetical protein
MIRQLKFAIPALMITLGTTLVVSCGEGGKDMAAKSEAVQAGEEQESQAQEKPLTEEFKKYWYAGEAEITSYTLKQARYGEMRTGTRY